LIRYVYIFWLKNLASFNDDFWYLLINVWVVAFSFISQVVTLRVKINFWREKAVAASAVAAVVAAAMAAEEAAVTSAEVVLQWVRPGKPY
jgi:hypothetical protein